LPFWFSLLLIFIPFVTVRLCSRSGDEIVDIIDSPPQPSLLRGGRTSFSGSCCDRLSTLKPLEEWLRASPVIITGSMSF
jgi:hypothetical protein